MDNITIEMLPANEGDSILLTVGDNITILIDGGTKDTYYSTLKPRLLQLNESKKCIDLLIVTHIDDDHIGGILELLKENGSNKEAKIIKIKNIWHNSYRHLQFEKGKMLGIEEAAILRQYIAIGEAHSNLSQIDGHKEVSVKQGTTLAALILQGGYLWNCQFDGKAICSDEKKNIVLGAECEITVLTPGEKALKQLEKIWKKN